MKKNIYFVIFASLLLIMGCEDSNVETTNIEQTLLSLIDGDEALAPDGEEEEDARDEEPAGCGVARGHGGL